MGRCETAKSVIGITTTLEHLYLILGKKKAEEYLDFNCEIIDSNGYYNEIFQEIINSNCKDMEHEFKTRNDGYGDNLYIQTIAIECNTILETCRSGYNRECTNSSCKNLDIYLDEVNKVKKDLKDYADKIGLTEYEISHIIIQDVY